MPATQPMPTTDLAIPPMWAGRTVVIAASGPSLAQAQLDAAAAARPRPVRVVVNTTFRRWPDADMLYACDGRWWDVHDGAPDFRGERWTQHAGAAAKWGLRRVRAAVGLELSFDPTRIGTGANSGFQALNIAILARAARVLLIGFDMGSPDGKAHWHGDHPAKLNNPNDEAFANWRQAFGNAAAALRAARHPVEIVNCSAWSALDCFPRGDIATCLAS